MSGAGAGSSATPSSSSAAEDPSAGFKDGLHQNHPFFSYYGLMIHQQNMMADLVRTGAYHDAIVKNAADFKDKVVVDVGTGSGILAWFALKAGARKVYAIEASNVADRAAQLMRANKADDRIVVIKSTVETASVPEPVRRGQRGVGERGRERDRQRCVFHPHP